MFKRLCKPGKRAQPFVGTEDGREDSGKGNGGMEEIFEV
jgi:hypothetical protein